MESLKENEGFLYIATGDKYVAEAEESVRSLRKAMNGVRVHLFTDDPGHQKDSLFDSVSVIENPSFDFNDKIQPLLNSPFEKTVFLDTDTIILHEIGELFGFLDKHDLGFCHAPWRGAPGFEKITPDWFPEPNTGVIAFRTCPAVHSLFEKWAAIYEEQRNGPRRPPHDQPAFRLAVYESSLDYGILPPEYNMRPFFPHFRGGNALAKILHGRGYPLRALRRRVNRTHRPWVGKLSFFDRAYWWLCRKAGQD